MLLEYFLNSFGKESEGLPLFIHKSLGSPSTFGSKTIMKLAFWVDPVLSYIGIIHRDPDIKGIIETTYINRLWWIDELKSNRKMLLCWLLSQCENTYSTFLYNNSTHPRISVNSRGSSIMFCLPACIFSVTSKAFLFVLCGRVHEILLWVEFIFWNLILIA